ncbi:MAG: hypothetical protein Q7R22_000775 [Verrucomicrobiota bacterium JB025]|nr:hypothetical protein [Verrucomicrobiota bacterium JB025]
MRTLLLLIALLLPLSAQETLIREVHDPKTDTHVEVTALFSQASRSGFFPVRVKIANNQNVKHTIHLNSTATPGYRNSVSSKASFSFEVGPGKSATHDILIPLAPCPSASTNYTSVNFRLTGTMGDSMNGQHDQYRSGHPSVLLSETLFTPNGSALDSALSGSSTRSYSNEAFAGKFDPKQLPTDWLAFSGYDSVLMTDTDWSATPPGSRNAILSWLRLGGQLVIYSSSTPTRASLGLPEETSFGTIVFEHIASDLKLNPKATVALVQKENPARTITDSILNDYRSGWPLQHHFGKKAFSYGLFILVLILFAILVGPVNLFVFAKSGRRHRLFITTPVISLGASLVLIALIIFQDGFGGAGSRRILMEVRPDAGLNAAFIHQEQFTRTGILTGTRFSTDPACLLTPVPIGKSRWARYTNHHSTSGVFNLQPTGGGKLNASGDWFQSRSEHGHIASAVIPTRGRIEHGPTPQTLVSTFDFPIQTLFYMDDSKNWFRAENIQTGKPFTITPVEYSMISKTLASQANQFSKRNRRFLTKAENRPGHFVALTDSAPAIETLAKIRWKETQTVITGPVVR